MYSKNGTYDAGHGTSLLQVAKEHFFLVEHLGGFMLRLFRMDKDGAKEIACSISHPHFFNSVERKNNLKRCFLGVGYERQQKCHKAAGRRIFVEFCNLYFFQPIKQTEIT